MKKFLLEQRCDKKREGVPLPLRMSIDIASGLHCLHANYYYHRCVLLMWIVKMKLSRKLSRIEMITESLRTS